MKDYKEVTDRIKSRKESLSMATVCRYPVEYYDLYFDYLNKIGDKERTILHIDITNNYVKVASCYDYNELKTRYDKLVESDWYDMPNKHGKMELFKTIDNLLERMRIYYDNYKLKTYYAE